MDEIDKNIESLEGIQADLRRQEMEVRKLLEEYYLKRTERDYGLKLGGVVTYEGKEYGVVRISHSSPGDKPWVEGRVRKRDGNWGTRNFNLFNDWEVKSES